MQKVRKIKFKLAIKWIVEPGLRIIPESHLVKEEGTAALYKGITPRIMRVAPGQAVTFTVYEFIKEQLAGDNSPVAKKLG